MSADNKNIEINRQLIAVLDELLQSGDWEASLFLRTTSKRFKELRHEAEQLLEEATETKLPPPDVMEIEKAGHIKIFVSIYQAESTNLQKWYAALKSLTEHSVSRPIYRQADPVKSMIRSKADPQREGYAVIWIKEEGIIHTGKTLLDRMGNELLSLKPDAIKLDNIIEFVHGNKRYSLSENGLVFKGEVK